LLSKRKEIDQLMQWFTGTCIGFVIQMPTLSSLGLWSARLFVATHLPHSRAVGLSRTTSHAQVRGRFDVGKLGTEPAIADVHGSGRRNRTARFFHPRLGFSRTSVVCYARCWLWHFGCPISRHLPTHSCLDTGKAVG